MALRRLYMTRAEIAELLAMALSTVSAVLKRLWLGKRSRLKPLEPPNRYERKRPGELSISTSRSSDVSPAPAPRERQPSQPEQPPRPPHPRELGWSSSTSPSTTRHGSPTPRSSQTNKAQPLHLSSTAQSRVRLFRDQSGTRPLRQRRLLPLERPRARLPPARNPPPLHTPLQATHQPQGRALH